MLMTSSKDSNFNASASITTSRCRNGNEDHLGLTPKRVAFARQVRKSAHIIRRHENLHSTPSLSCDAFGIRTRSSRHHPASQTLNFKTLPTLSPSPNRVL